MVEEKRDAGEGAAAAREIPELLRLLNGQDPNAPEKLFSLLYEELHRIAASHLRRRDGALTLGATTLVHEAYLRMGGGRVAAFPERGHFFAYASRAMRGLVIDYSRRRHAKKRGRHFELTVESIEEGAPVDGASAELLALNDAVEELHKLEPALGNLVDLHFFGGLSFVEIAALRTVSERTVQRDWKKARLLLRHSLQDAGSSADII